MSTELTLMDSMRLYKNSPAVNQSFLKNLIKHKLDTEEDEVSENKDFQRIGTIVDILMTCPETLESRVHVYQVPIPGEKPVKIVDYLLSKVFTDVQLYPPFQKLGDYLNLKDLMDQFQYRGNLSDQESRFEKLKDEAAKYYTERVLLLQTGKMGVDAREAELAYDIESSLKNHEFTAPIFDINHPDITVQYQKILYFTVLDVPCKAMLDMVIINNSKDDITIGPITISGKSILPIDIKTTGGSTIYFPYQIKRNRLDFQAAFYTKGLENSLSGYKIDNFHFIVESTSKNRLPLIYKLSDFDLLVGTFGGYHTKDGIKFCEDWYVHEVGDSDLYYPGIYQALAYCKRHAEQDQWDIPAYIVDSSGYLMTEVYK